MKYIDGILDAWHDGAIGRNVHLGYWNPSHRHPESHNSEKFEQAQQALTDYLLGRLTPLHGCNILDVGCGIGGCLDYLNTNSQASVITALNIDPRQLDVCRTIVPRNQNQLNYVLADACAIPIPNGCQDIIICIEAQFHFTSRMAFLHEATRILRPKGKLILTDILINPLPTNTDGQAARPSNQQIRTVLNDGFGPWPEPFLQYSFLIEAAKQAGLKLIDDANISDNTLPSYDYICPEYKWVASEHLRNSGVLLAWLQANGHASYHYACFEKT